MNTDDYIQRVCDSLQRIGLSGDVRDDGQSVQITLADEQAITISHKFLRMVNKKQLDYRILFGAGLVKESKGE